jgi:hypothetical protein
LDRDRSVEPELAAQPSRVGGAGSRSEEEGRGIARRQAEEGEGERQHAPVQQHRARGGAEEGGGAHAVISHRSRLASTCAALATAFSLSCIAPQRPDDVLVLASGADLESANPLVTTHTLARQIQRYALLVTLTRYDSALAHQPYYARRWRWSDDRRALTLSLAGDLRWHDGIPTTARDAAFTLLAAKDPATGFPARRGARVARHAVAVDDNTLALRFAVAMADLPPYLAELPTRARAICSARCRARHFAPRRSTMRPSATARSSSPLGVPARGWTFVRNERFPASLGGPPALRGLTGRRRRRGDDEVRRPRER